MYITEPLLMFMYDFELLVRIVVTMKIVYFFAGYSGYCVNDILWGMLESNIFYILILQTSTYVQKSILMKGSTSFLHKYNVCQNKHQTGSREIVCCLFPVNMLLCLTGQLVVDVTRFTCFAALMLHRTLHMNVKTGGLLLFCDVTLEYLGFITNYSIPNSSLESLYRFLFFSVSYS
jgi:hypothetical protein